MIYLDNNATTALSGEVLEAMMPYLGGLFANPGSAHHGGMVVRQAVGEARSTVSEFIDARPSEIVFTGSATEANHLAVRGVLARRPGRRKLVTTAIEHPSHLMLFDRLAAEGYDVVRLPVDPQGQVDPGAIAEAVDDDTALVSMMWANNDTGVVLPIGAACEVAHGRGALFHTDAVQMAGRLAVSVGDVPVDLLTFSGHKLHGPKGIGVLFVRKGLDLDPVICGSQERGRRGGTENVPAIVGLAEAVALASDHIAGGGPQRVARLRDTLEAGLLARWPGARVNGRVPGRLPNTTNIAFADAGGRPVDGEAVLTLLDRAGIAVSQGAACTAAGHEPSHVLLAMGRSQEEALSALRFSLSRETTDSDIDAVLAALPAIAARLAA